MRSLVKGRVSVTLFGMGTVKKIPSSIIQSKMLPICYNQATLCAILIVLALTAVYECTAPTTPPWVSNGLLVVTQTSLI